MLYKVCALGVGLGLVCSLSFASPAVPVVDFSVDRSVHVAQDAQPTSVTQATRVLARRLDNYDQQHLPEKLDFLQRQLQRVQGQLDNQAHALEGLSKRLAALAMAPKPPKTQQYQAAVSSSQTKVDSKVSHDVQAYRAAFELLQAKQYAKAVAAFKQFSLHYPKSQYVANANYWLAQIHQLQGHPKEAVALYRVVVEQYPKSPKVADSLYQLALIARRQGELAQSKRYLETLIRTFPHQAIAGLAKTQMQQLSAVSARKPHVGH